MSALTLERPLLVLDVETTGTDVINDQITEIGILKIFPDKTTKYMEFRCKPSCPIGPEASEITGLTDEILAQYEPFSVHAQQVWDFMEGCDIAGFNSDRFDLPIIFEELSRAGVETDTTGLRTIDAMKIYHDFNRRNLTNAYKHYCNKELVDSHTAKADIFATAEILMAQIKEHELGHTVEELSVYTNRKEGQVDFGGYLALNDKGEVCIAFGSKHKGKTVAEVWKNDRGYINWINSNQFPVYTKFLILKEIKKLSGTV